MDDDFREEVKQPNDQIVKKPLFGVKKEIKPVGRPLGQKRPLRPFDEEMLRMINIEFIIKQSVNFEGCEKQKILPSQLIRTTDVCTIL